MQLLLDIINQFIREAKEDYERRQRLGWCMKWIDWWCGSKYEIRRK